MQSYNLEIDAIHGIVKVGIARKSVKNISLKVCSNLDVLLSVPTIVEDDFISALLISKKKWIAKQLTKYKQSQGYNSLVNIKNGAGTQFIGKDMRILKMPVSKNEKERVEIEEKNLVVYVKDILDDVRFNKLFQTFWRRQAGETFQKEVDKIYTKIFKKYEIEKPSIKVRKMKTLWGSCIQSKNKITFNEYLLKANMPCIQYVVLHELTHLLYPYHNKAFYTFLTIHMPDWKTRKERLDKDVVQGL